MGKEGILVQRIVQICSILVGLGAQIDKTEEWGNPHDFVGASDSVALSYVNTVGCGYSTNLCAVRKQGNL